MLKVVITILISWLFLSEASQASTLYLNALPDLFLNQTAGNLRSNVAFTESDPQAEFDGTDVTLATSEYGSNAVVVNSITTWSVASVLGQPLGDEFNSVFLYFRPEGGTWQLATDANGNSEIGTPNTFFDSGNSNLVLDSNPDITHTLVPYRVDVRDYQSLDPGSADTYYPVWQNTFSNLDLVLQPGVDYEFAVWGTSLNQDPTTEYGYWFNHYSNAFLSGAEEDNKSGTYLRCDATNLSAPCFTEDPRVDQTWDKGANLNIDIEGFVTPEPSSFVLMSGFGLIAIIVFLRKRTYAASSRG